MNRQWTALRVAMLAALTFGLWHPTHVLADADGDNGWAKSKVTFALDQIIVNGCNGEFTHILGVGVISVKSRVNPDGTLGFKEHDLFRGDGTGTSGAQYMYHEIAHIDESLGPNPDGTPFSYLERRKQRLVGLGDTPDQFITFYIQLVIDGAGNVTVDIFNVNIECK
jgi:hypothetical protein